MTGRLKGQAYLLYETTPRPLVGDGVLLVGDAAGLAYAPSGEGIRTAVESGLLAAQMIRECHERYGRTDLAPYRNRIKARFGRRRSSGGLARLLPARAVEALGAGLLASRFLTRRVILDRWFLHAHQPALSPTLHPLRVNIVDQFLSVCGASRGRARVEKPRIVFKPKSLLRHRPLAGNRPLNG